MSEATDPLHPSSAPKPTARLRATVAEGLFDAAAVSGPPEALPTPGELQRAFPQYEILSLLGRGGMGVVYKGRHKGLDRLVAIKLLPPALGCDAEFGVRFQREARATARLEHPNIVTVHDYGQTADGRLFIVMEYVDGANLAELIRSGAVGRPAPGQQPVGTGDPAGNSRRGEAGPRLDPLAVASQLCDALAYAHSAGIIHRDIKPANVIIDRRGRVKVADFGLARLIDAEIDATALTTTGTVMGTLDYMAPEQRKGMAVDQRADIYSLGILLYELLCGEIPHGVFAPPSQRGGCDPRLDAIIHKALQQKPEQRYQNTTEMKADVDDLRGGTDVPAKSSGRQGTQPLAGPNSLRYTLALVLALLLLAAWWFLEVRTSVPEAPVRSAVPLGQPAQKPNNIERLPPGAASTVPTEPWREHLEELRSDPNLKRSDFEGDGSLRPANGKHLLLSPGPARDCAIRITAIGAPGARNGGALKLRHNGETAAVRTYTLNLADGTCRIQFQQGTDTEGRYTSIKAWPLPSGFDYAAEHTYELRAVGDLLSIRIDGEEIGSVRDTTLTEPGRMGFYVPGNTRIRSVQTLVIDGSQAAGTVGAENPLEGWKDYLAQLRADPSWSAHAAFDDDGALVRWRQGYSLVLFGEPPRCDAAIRASFVVPAPKTATLELRNVRDPAGESLSGYRIKTEPDALHLLLHRYPGESVLLVKWPYPAGFDPLAEHTWEFRAVGDLLSVFLDERPLGSHRDSAIAEPGRMILHLPAEATLRALHTLGLEKGK